MKLRFHFSSVALLLVLSSTVLLPAAALAQVADLSVTKTGPDEAAAGANVNYTIHVFNFGPDNSLTATLRDRVPDGTTFVSVTPPPGWSCTDPDPMGTNTLVCTNSSVPVGADDVFSFVVNINPQTPPGHNHHQWGEREHPAN